MTSDQQSAPSRPRFRITRRGLGLAACTALTAPIAGKLAWDHLEGLWSANVFIAGVPTYQSDLRSAVQRGLAEVGFPADRVKRKSVLLKPNLIEPADQAQAVLTDPAVVHATAEAFLSMGARHVIVGDGPGHCRDARLVAEVGGLKPVLRDLKVRFVDLNHGPVVTQKNALGMTTLSSLYLSDAVVAADIVVSIAKLKTHHWAGVTLTMKNLFGTLPGICYGWPKNVFHQLGINPSILDVCATVKPDVSIVDGIIGMEGDGPIMGSPRPAGVLIVGNNPVAVDATATRLIGGHPEEIDHLRAAAGVLGPLQEAHIVQRGDPIQRHATRFLLPPTGSASPHTLLGG